MCDDASEESKVLTLLSHYSGRAETVVHIRPYIGLPLFGFTDHALRQAWISFSWPGLLVLEANDLYFTVCPME